MTFIDWMDPEQSQRFKSVAVVGKDGCFGEKSVRKRSNTKMLRSFSICDRVQMGRYTEQVNER